MLNEVQDDLGVKTLENRSKVYICSMSDCNQSIAIEGQYFCSRFKPYR